jgi:ABC-type transport system substrate-binding protein
MPAVAQQGTGTTLRFIPHADLSILDPYFTGVYITRNYGYMVYDTLFAMDSAFRPQPQMVDTWRVSDDRLTYTFTLREGLKFHDGQPVRATDVVASLKRWGQRNDAYGQPLLAAAAAIERPTVGYRCLEWSIVSMTTCKSRCFSAEGAAVAPNASATPSAATHRFVISLLQMKPR